MEKKITNNGNYLPEIEKSPTITKNNKNDTWVYVDARTVLVSSHKSDKEYMERSLREWRKRQKI